MLLSVCLFVEPPNGDSVNSAAGRCDPVLRSQTMPPASPPDDDPTCHAVQPACRSRALAKWRRGWSPISRGCRQRGQPLGLATGSCYGLVHGRGRHRDPRPLPGIGAARVEPGSIPSHHGRGGAWPLRSELASCRSCLALHPGAGADQAIGRPLRRRTAPDDKIGHGPLRPNWTRITVRRRRHGRV